MTFGTVCFSAVNILKNEMIDFFLILIMGTLENEIIHILIDPSICNRISLKRYVRLIYK